MATSPSPFGPDRAASTRAPRSRPFGKLIAVISALAITVAAGGIAVASVAAADAETPTVTSDCSTLHVNLANYTAPTASTDKNTVSVTVAGALVETTDFATSFTKDYAFADATKATSWSVAVTAWDDPNGTSGGTKTITGTSTPCPAPTVTATAYQPTATVDTGSVKADFGNLVVGRTYLLSFSSASKVLHTQTLKATATTDTETVTQLDAGQAYTVKIVDSVASSLSASAVATINGTTTTSVGMVLALWKKPAGAVYPQQLLGYMKTSFASANSADLTKLKAKYAADLNCALFQADVYADDSKTALLLSRGVLTEQNVKRLDESWPAGTDPTTDPNLVLAPTTAPYCLGPVTVAIDPVVCTAIGGTTGFNVTLTGLVVGREYRLGFTGGVASDTFTATSTAQTVSISAAVGSQVTGTTITDVQTGLVLGTSTTSLTVSGCPQAVQLSITGTQCTTVGGSVGTVAVNMSGLVVGRSYTLTATGASAPVSFTASATSYTATLSGTAGTAITDLKLTDTTANTVVGTSSESFTPLACPTKVGLTFTPTQCTTVGGTSKLTVTLTGLVAGRSYSVEVTTDPVPAQTVTSANPVVTFLIPPGELVTAITVTDTTVAGAAPVVASSTTPISYTTCPELASLAVNVAQCTAPGGFAGLQVTASQLTAGHSYTLETTVASNGTVAPVTFTADSTADPVTKTVNISPNDTVTALQLYDVTAGARALVASDTSQHTLTACPVSVTVSVVPCTAAGQNSTLNVVLSQLVVGHSYTVKITELGTSSGSTASTVLSQTVNNVTSTTATVPFTLTSVSVQPVVVYDVTTGTQVQVAQDATQHTIAGCVAGFTVVPTQCTAPGGSAGLSVSLSELAPGSRYQLAVEGVTVAPVVFTATSDVETVTLAIPPGSTLTGLKLSDLTSTTVTNPVASYTANITFQACPNNPSVTATTAACVSGTGSSNITVTSTNLVAGKTWRVEVDYKNANGDWITAGLKSDLSSDDAASVSFTGVPGTEFRASVVSTDGLLSAVYEWSAAACVIPAAVASLAFTGADVFGPGLIGLLILQGGIALIGVALIRRRRNGDA